MGFTLQEMEIPGVFLISPDLYSDDRGQFFEQFRVDQFEEMGIEFRVNQSNCSVSKAGVIRGIHYQLPPMSQAKLIECSAGSIFDVAVDLRMDSPTFLKWCGVCLSPENKSMFYIPEGFGHGFIALKDHSEVRYHLNQIYAPEQERGLLWDDPDLGIHWPEVKPLIVSKKDQQQLTVKAAMKQKESYFFNCASSGL
jgi:dTDP-4-dehydrorhamnose 3,5-epimerase